LIELSANAPPNQRMKLTGAANLVSRGIKVLRAAPAAYPYRSTSETQRMGGVFGALAWNPRLDWWSGTAAFAPGHRIDLHVEAAKDQAAMRAAVARAEPAWERLRDTEPSVRAAVAGQLTDAHNRYCDPEDEVTEAQFAGRLRLLSAKFGASGGAELVYADGMLFGGHWIVVPISADGAVGEAAEAG
jgi:hypothetical protein